MSETVIKVENLSKQYRIGEHAGYKTLREAIIDVVKAPLLRIRGAMSKTPSTKSPGIDSMSSTSSYGPSSRAEYIWALKDVSFEVKQGEIIGIIGRNGAGKSTLLKILSKITEPTEGRVELRGRVGSLLEVGTGFHPELTGHENIYLYGAILGMDRYEVTRKFDEIVAFAELEKFIDTPVKRYSSGMYMRLAFAVAAHLEPEILLIDEVLAVGDTAFQKKCLGKMGDVAKEGRTVLFVSHNMSAVENLCKQAIWLDNGQIVVAGSVMRAISSYLQEGAQSVLEKVWDEPSNAPGGEKVRVHRVSVIPHNVVDGELITVKTPLQLEFEFWNYLGDAVLNFSVLLYSIKGVCIFNTVSQAKSFSKGLVRGSFTIPGNFLNNGVYTLRLLIVKDQSVALLDLNDVLMFEVHDVSRKSFWHGEWIGAVRPNFKWNLEKMREDS